MTAINIMMAMDSYKTLVAWQMAHLVASVVLDLIGRHWKYRNRSILDQLSRAALSIEANIVEGYALGTDAYMHKHTTHRPKTSGK